MAGAGVGVVPETDPVATEVWGGGSGADVDSGGSSTFMLVFWMSDMWKLKAARKSEGKEGGYASIEVSP